jgi:hypothetical protein
LRTRADDVRGADDDRLRLGRFQKKDCASMSTSMRSRISLNEAPPRRGASSGEELRVVGARAVHVGAREDDELGHVVLRDVLEQALEAGDVPAVVLRLAGARIVHDPEVHDGGELVLAEDVLRLLFADVDREVLDVLGAAGELAPIDADHLALAVERAREAAAEAPADARDQDRPLALVTGRRALRRSALDARRRR